jgi:CHAT domain-containing protein/tetratricopeptide (TPR) repeat protein
MIARGAAFFTHLLASAGLATVLLLGSTAASLTQQSSPAQSEAPALKPEEAAFEERIRAAYGQMGTADGFEEGYRQLRAVLVELARTELFAFTVLKYTEAGQIFHQNSFGQEAEEVFSEGEQTRAMREDVRERADFYLAYGHFKVAIKDFGRVVPLLTTATNLYKQYYGEDSAELLNGTDVLATSLATMGQYGTALNFLQDNYDRGLTIFGPNDRMVWRFANNLADTLRAVGAPNRALQYDLMLLEKRTGYYGRDHFNVLVTANNTAQNYLDLRDYPQALRYFELNRQIAVALRVQDPILEPQAEDWILYTHVIAGEQPLDEKTVAHLDGLISNDQYPAMLSYRVAHLLAEHFAGKGDKARSMKLLEQALSVANYATSPFHPWVFETRRAIANAKAVNDPAAAAADYAKLDRDMLEWVAMQARFSGGRDFGEATRALADDMLYDYAQLAEKHPSIVPAFADAARRWPTLEDAGRENLRKVMRLVDPTDEETLTMLRRLLQISMTMQEIFAVGVGEALGHQMLEQMKPLEDKINERISERYPEIDQATLDRPLPAAREVLGANEAMVAYFVTRKWRADREGEQPLEDVRLYAVVSRKDREPRLHYLGDPREITSHQPSVEVAMVRSTRPAERGAISISEMGDVFSGLYGSLLAPFESDLSDVATVFIVPDGQLFAVPFSLLEDEKGRLLEERFTVRLLTRQESLYGVAAGQNLAKGGRAVLAGGLDYTNGAEKGAAPLPGTLQEVEAIARLLGSDQFTAETLTGAAATEAVLKAEMETAAVAHLATHGAYNSAKNGGAANVDTLWQSEVILSKSGDRHAMTRDEGDGRLYAFELMTWDLSKLDLLVLSACETGRGEETFVGGLRGLPTAVNIAGARRSLLTLLPVADEGTANFMTRFYEHLVGGMSYADALRQTRRDAIAGNVPGAKSPLVWAAFVMFEN